MKEENVEGKVTDFLEKEEEEVGWVVEDSVVE